MSGVPGDLAHWQQQLADALIGPARDWQERHRQDSFVTTPDQFVTAQLAALLPVLQAYGDARAAQTLTDAAHWLGEDEDHGGAPLVTTDNERLDVSDPGEVAGMNWAIQSLLDRAAALLARTDTEGAHDGSQ